MSTLPKIIVIVGPTASGKSSLAIRLAKHLSNLSRINSNKSRIKNDVFENNLRKRIREPFERYKGAEIISADSRQVYRGLNIGSGKITEKEMVSIPHYLLSVASPKRTFTVVQYQKLAKNALQKILAKNKIPIICGGTGFYIDALIHNYNLPAVPPQFKLRKQLEQRSTEELFEQLKRSDSRRAKNIDRYNKRRLIRALEIILATGKIVPPKNYLIPRSRDKIVNYEILKIGIKKSPEELKKLIKKRLLKRLKIGLIEEVRKLRREGLGWQRLDDLGLEYRYISRHLRGLTDKKQMIDLILKESWQYAKRQMTWFKRDKEIIWIDNPQKASAICRDFLCL